jgi:hypothetical protein
MTGSYRKSRPLNRNEQHVRDTNLIIIATEGKRREQHYFTMDLFTNNKKIQIQIIPAFDNKSSPKDVLNKLHEYASEFQFDENDQFWLVIDKDRWDKAGLYEIISLCNYSNYRVALSNPCFELWLLLHFRKVNELELTENMSCTDIKNIFNPQLAERDEGSYEATFARWIPHALQESPKLDNHPKAPLPDCPGTRVYRLVEQLIS